MSQLGLGVLINTLSGQRGADILRAALGKTIADLSLTDDALHFVFADGSRMRLRDNGQSCCESRYMTTEADLAAFVGATLNDVELRDAPDGESGYEVHERQHVDVKTSAGTFTVTLHNEHNGYYGGFWLVAAEADAK